MTSDATSYLQRVSFPYLIELTNKNKNFPVYFEILGHLVLVLVHLPCSHCKPASRRLHRSENVSKSPIGANKEISPKI